MTAAAAAAATPAAAAVAALPAATLAAVLPAAAAPPIPDAGSAFAAVARAPWRAQMPGAFFRVEIAGSSSCAVSSTGRTDSSLGRRSSRC